MSDLISDVITIEIARSEDFAPQKQEKDKLDAK